MVKANIEYFIRQGKPYSDIKRLLAYYCGKKVRVLYNKAGIETVLKGSLEQRARPQHSVFTLDYAVITPKSKRMISGGNIITIQEAG